MATMPSTSTTGQPDPVTNWFGSAAGQALLDSECALALETLHLAHGLPWLWLAPAQGHGGAQGQGRGLRLSPDAPAAGLRGDVRCGLPLPLASESIGVVVLQHVLARGPGGDALLEECARVLVPGGRLALFALNPLAPYRWRWRGAGLGASEPLASRRRLRRAGLVPDPVSQGVGPTWKVAVAPEVQQGAGLRAAYLLRAEKRRMPLTPARTGRRLAGPRAVAAA